MVHTDCNDYTQFLSYYIQYYNTIFDIILLYMISVMWLSHTCTYFCSFVYRLAIIFLIYAGHLVIASVQDREVKNLCSPCKYTLIVPSGMTSRKLHWHLIELLVPLRTNEETLR